MNRPHGGCSMAMKAFHTAVVAGVLLTVGCSPVALAQDKDLIGRPVDLDVSKGIQAPYRDVTKLPTTFEAAAKTQPSDPTWGTKSYRPRDRRDLSGIWINQGGIGWV